MVKIMDQKSKKKILIYGGIIIVIYIVVPVMLYFWIDKQRCTRGTNKIKKKR